MACTAAYRGCSPRGTAAASVLPGTIPDERMLLMADAAKPLDGIVVLDFSQVMMGPCCTQILGDYGADVIKIERGSGDLSRTSRPDPAGYDNPIFLSLNRNKRSLVLNTKTPEGKQIVYDLVKRADVVVSNFRPGSWSASASAMTS